MNLHLCLLYAPKSDTSQLNRMPRGIPNPKPQPRKPLITYGWPGNILDITHGMGDKAQTFFDMWAFSHQVPIDEGGFPRTKLFWDIADNLLPGWFERNRWTDRLIDALCNEQWIGIAGCASASKTFNVAGFATAWWCCDPAASSVIFCSTTSKSLRKRSWAEVAKAHTTIPGPRVGNFVDSRMIWQARKGDDKHAIVGIAVEEGDVNKVADNIKGVHTKRQMVVITEATAVPHAIFEACTNLYSYPEQSGGEFLLVMEANPRSWMDEFGKFIEPDKGIGSVTVDDEEWETKPQINGRKGICIRFDVEKSPNLDYPPDKPISKHLPTHARVQKLANNPGYKDTPSYWSNERGFPPPEGINKQVFSEVALRMCGAYDRHKFTGENFSIIGAFDPARTGDRPVLKFGALGEIEGGIMGIEWCPPIVIPVNVKSSNPIDFQLYESVRQHCQHVIYRGTETHCLPENLAIDTTGAGAGLCDIFHRLWSAQIKRICFSEAASIDACSHEDVRPANEVYRNKRAEMYMRTRAGLDSSQIKGVDSETAKEMLTIKYDDTGKLLVIQSKEQYREDYKKSCDLSDAAVMLVELARRKGFKIAAIGQTKLREQDWEKENEASQAVYDVQYAPEEMLEPVEDIFA